MTAAGSELLDYTGAALRHLQGNADSTQDGGKAASGVNSIPSRMNPPITRHAKNIVALPLSIAIHPAGAIHEDRGTYSAESSPRAGGGHGSSTPLANSSPHHGSSTIDDNLSLSVPATVRLSSNKVREICSPYSTDKKIPLASRRGNSKQVHASHLRVSRQSLRQGVLRTKQDSALHKLDTSDDSIVVSMTEPSSENCKLEKQKLLKKLSAEQEAHQVVVTPVIVNQPKNTSSVDLDGCPNMVLAARSEASRDDGGHNPLVHGGCDKPEHRQGQISLAAGGNTATTHQRVVAGGLLQSSDMEHQAVSADGDCHDSQMRTMGLCISRRNSDNPCAAACDLEGCVHGQSIDILKRLQTLEHLHRACTVNSAKLLTKACDDVIQMSKKRDTCVTCSTQDHESAKPIKKMADDSTQTMREQLLMTVAPKQSRSMECLPVDKNKHPTKYSRVERTLPPIEQLEVVAKATRVLDEVKRAHEALEAESALLERKHQQAGLGKFLLSQSEITTVSDLENKKKDVPVHRSLGQGKQEKVTRKGNVNPLVKHTNASAVQVKRLSKETPTHLQKKPIQAQLNAKDTRRGMMSMAAPPSIRPAPYIQPTKLTIPPPPLPPPPPPPPPQSLLITPHSVPTMAPYGVHPPQTVAIPLFTPQAVPSHETLRQPHGSEASTQTCLPVAEKPGCVIATVGCSFQKGTQHLPLVNITTSELESITPSDQAFDEEIPSGDLQSPVLGLKDENKDGSQEVPPQSLFVPATGRPMEASHLLDDRLLEEVIICGQVDPPEQPDSEPCFRAQVPGLMASVCQSGTVTLEELEQRLNEHVMSQAQQWIQQELCAQVMAKVSLPSDPTVAMEPDARSNSCSTCFLHSDQSTAHNNHSDAVLQWFTHAGVPMDSELVHKLVQEIVVEHTLALGGNTSDVDTVSYESPSEEEEQFSYTPPTSKDASLVTLVPTPKPTPPPSSPPSPPPHKSPTPPFIEMVSTPNPTPPPTSPRSERPIRLQDELAVTPQSTETGDISTSQTSAAPPSVRSQPPWHMREGEGRECISTPSATPPPPLPLQLSPAATPQSAAEEQPCDQVPAPQPAIGESPATKEPSLSESASSSSCVAHTSDLHTSSTTSDREISMGELIKHSVSHGPGVSLSEGEVLLSPGDARWQTFHTKMSGLFPATEKMATAHQMPMLGLKEVGGASQNDTSEASSDGTHCGMEAWSEGQTIRGHFGGFLSKINTSTPENSTRTPNHTDDDDDSTHPMTDTTFAEGMHTSLPASREPGQVISDRLDHIVASHGADQQRASHDADQQRAFGQQRAGQPGAASPGEVHKPVILNRSMSLSECNLDSMTSASEGEVKLETRGGIDVIRVSQRSSRTSSESKPLKQRDKMVTGGQHITVSETDPLVNPATLQSNDGTVAPTAAGDGHDACPIILVSARKNTSNVH